MMPFTVDWTCIDAIFCMFFSDDADLKKYEINELGLREICKQSFERRKQHRSEGEASGLQRRVDALVDAIKVSMPNMVALSRRHPVIWARWGFQDARVPVSNVFIQELAIWKLSVSASNVMLYKDAGKKTWRGRILKLQGVEKGVGYLLDELILGRSIKGNPYLLKWKMRPRILVPVNDNALAHVRKQSAKIASPSVHRGVNQVCGTNAVTLLKNAIHRAVGSKEVKVLHSKKIENRYCCDISRTQLVELLQIKYPEIRNFEVGTLCRALSSFVKCPRGRPGGLPSLQIPRKSTKKKPSSESPRLARR